MDAKAMTDGDRDDIASSLANEKALTIGYGRPPVRSQFKPGQSGNPKGRAKGSQNLKTLFHKVLKEEVSLREGSEVRRVSKAEAIMRGLIVGALKGDARSVATLLRVAEQVGAFNEPADTGPTKIVFTWRDPSPANSQPYREEP